MLNRYGQNSNWTNPDVGSPYLQKLVKEKNNLALIGEDLPICNKLLNQEILRVSEMFANQDLNAFDRLQLGSPSLSNPLDMMPDVAAISPGRWDRNSGWNPFHHEPQGSGRRLGLLIDNQYAAPSSSCSSRRKKWARVDVPVDLFPNFNFVGRLLGPRGNSMKRIEAHTGCRVFIRGRGSMRDPKTEEQLRGSRNYEHLNEPLHILIETEAPAYMADAKLRQAQEIIEDLLIPMEPSQDFYKKRQLKELAVLHSRSREGSSQSSSSASNYRSSAMRRSTTTEKGTCSSSYRPSCTTP